LLFLRIWRSEDPDCHTFLSFTEKRLFVMTILLDDLLHADSEAIRDLLPSLMKMPVVEVAEVLQELEMPRLGEVLALFPADQQAYLLAEFPYPLQRELMEAMGYRAFAGLMELMASEYRADFYQELSTGEQSALLPFFSKQVRDNILQLSAYPPETAGGIMSTDFATVEQHMTCDEAIAQIRRDAPSKRTVYYIYVVDEHRIMQGFITLKGLIMAEADTPVSAILNSDFAFAYVDEDREVVALAIDKYDLVALPILNRDNQLVGIVTHDEAMDIIRVEQTEDMEKFMGITRGDEDLDYMETTTWTHFRRRVTWLVSLAVLGLVSGIIIHSYEEAMTTLIVLALYMPMVADTGGNTGSQAATVVIRALALGQVTVSNWFAILWKEARIALLLSLCLGVLAYGKVLFLSWDLQAESTLNLWKIAFVISLALSLQVVSSTIIGSALPLLVKRLGGDPAVAASPAITTVVDITGLLIYFSVATLFFAL
jgi:magnesium transporter